MAALLALTAACSTNHDQADPSTAAPPPPSTAEPAPAPRAASAIDCTAASRDIETLVCGDEALLALDRRLAEVYQRALATSSDAAGLEAEQRGWVAGRDECWQEPDRDQCVREAYQDRLVELQIEGAPVPPTVNYHCDDGSKALSAVFYNDIDPRAMILTWGADRAILFQQPSGSGIRYSRSDVSYAEHHGDVTAEFYGTRLTCTVQR